MRIAVTGGNGELGRRLIPYLLEQGHRIISLDRQLPPIPFSPLVDIQQYVIADTGDLGELVAVLRGCEAVIHLAAHRSPVSSPDPVVYIENTAGSYNVLSAAAILGIRQVCLASSVNAIGGAFSRSPRYDYFPLDEQHPTYAEDPYALSKWVLEQQGDAFARRHDWMQIASLRFHWIIENKESAVHYPPALAPFIIRHLWGYTLLEDACRACLLSISAEFCGHEVFYIVAPHTVAPETSMELARRYYPNTEIRGELSGHNSFFDCSKAGRILGWRHTV